MAMAGSLSKSKLLINQALPLSNSITRRGYAASSQGSIGVRLGKGGCMVGNNEVEGRPNKYSEDKEAAASAWIPDPLTGYYRPANRAVEIDPVELRQMLSNNKVRPL
ncbi:late embryogenesis abundant protein Lea5-like [Humulus lupulus]|uniref:late embryogenesis abundant protein Lea5-like n=1 Tax=Humulus lupulus TaxID=3486 RepID=UPI002B413EDA|nr:late embryogenesis abundant protein Lea5-like [Humulus lupulus]